MAEFIALSQLLPHWPGMPTLPAFLDDIILTDYAAFTGDRLGMKATIVLAKNIEFDFFGSDYFSVSVLQQKNFAGLPLQAYIKPELIIDLSAISFSFNIKRTFLHAARKNNGVWERDVVSGVEKPVSITFNNVGVRYTASGDLEFTALTQGSVTLSSIEIGSTGIFIEFGEVIPIFASKTALPAGVRAGSSGVFIKEASVTLPQFWGVNPTTSTGEIKGTNLFIGTGGFNGKLELKAKQAGNPAPLLETTIGGAFSISLDAFSITYLHDKVTDSEIQGTLKIPSLKDEQGNPATIAVDIDYTEEEIRISASSRTRLKALTIPDVLSFRVDGLSMGKKGNDYYIEVVGQLDIIAQIPGIGGRFIQDPIDIKRLVIWSNGEIDFEGGSIVLPKMAPLKVGPVELSVTALHIGKFEQVWNNQRRKYKYIGFDGGVKTGAGGVNARGEGIKFYFTVDGGTLHTFLRIETIRVDLRIPGTASAADAALILSGYVSMKNPQMVDPVNGQPALGNSPAATEYAGGVEFSLPKLKIAGGADLRMVPSTGAFLMDAHLELPTPIALGSTGLGIYGFRGAIGNKYVMDRKQGQSWLEFYKSDPRGVSSKKFKQGSGFALGAGVSLATMGDSGTIFSSKLFFMLALPDVFLLEGQAALLSKRVGLDSITDPPFYAAIFISSEGVEAGFGAHLNIPEPNGEILVLDATMEMAFYFGNSQAWHIYLGEDQPDTKRIKAKLLKLFDSWAYFMLSAEGIKAGAGVDWKFRKDCGIAVVGLGASLEVGGRVSFRPVQIGGWIRLAGYAELKVFGIGFRLTVSASLEAEAPKPFVVKGQFDLTLETPWPLPDVEIHVSLSWRFENGVNREENIVIDIIEKPHASLAAYKADSKFPAKAIGMMSSEPFLLNYVKQTYEARHFSPGQKDQPISAQPPSPHNMAAWLGNFSEFYIPQDSFIDIDFSKPVRPISNPGQGNASLKKIGVIQGGAIANELVPPHRGTTNQVDHSYRIENVRILYWNEGDSQWHDYDISTMNTPLLRLQSSSVIADKIKYGFWQVSEAGKYTKLRILGRTPFDRYDTLSPVTVGLPPTAVLCPEDKIERTCHNWVNITQGHTFAANSIVTDRRLSFQISGASGTVTPLPNIFGLTPALRLNAGNSIEFLLPYPTSSFSLKLSTLASGVRISYYRGYAYTPSAASSSGGQGGGGGTGTDSWDVAPVSGSDTGDGAETVWQRLAHMPDIVRAFCAAGAPGAGDAAVIAMTQLMDVDYLLTDVYLKQSVNLNETLPADFCGKLRSMLRTIIVGYTGRDPIPSLLLPNTDQFYLDTKRLAAEYHERNPGTLPSGASNEFYEKWSGLIACLGRLCDERGSLPSAIRTMIGHSIDPEIDRLYRRLGNADWFGQDMNERQWLWEPCEQLLSVAGFIASISMNIGAIQATGVIAALDPLYDVLERAYLRVARAVTDARLDTCTAADRSCNRWKEIVGVVRGLCIDPPVSSDTLTAIISLVQSFEQNKAGRIRDVLGWDTPSMSGGTGLCARLERVLPLVIVAYSALDDLPILHRRFVTTFHDELLRLVTLYRAETVDAPKGTPDPAADTFTTTWLDMLGCLCAVCDLDVMTALTAPQRAHLEGPIYSQLDTLYGVVAGEIFSAIAAGRQMSLYGTALPVDGAARVGGLINFFVGMLANCAGMPGAVTTLLANDLVAVQSAYTTLQSTLTTGGYLICSGQQTLPCQTWPVLLRYVRDLRARQWELPASVRNEIQNTIAPLVAAIYGNGTSVLAALPNERDTLLEQLDAIIGYYRKACLKGYSIDPLVQAAWQNDLVDVQDIVRDVIQFMPEFNGFDIGEAEGLDTCDRRQRLIDFQRIYCSSNSSAIPSATLILLVKNFNTTLGQITQALGLEAVSTTMADTDFCKAARNLVRVLTIAYGMQKDLPLGLVYAMKSFSNTLAVLVPGQPPVPAPGSCEDVAVQWINLLFCLCRVSGATGLFSEVDTGFQAVQSALEDAYAHAFTVADLIGVEFLPHRSTTARCRKLRVVSNYIAIRSLDYDAITSGLIPLISNRAAFEAAWQNEVFKPVREIICQPIPGPYDPLKKRETKTRLELLDEIVYESTDEPIDRVIIEPLAGCETGVPTDWTQVRAAVQTRLNEMSQDDPDRQAAQTFYNQLGSPVSAPACATYIHAVCWLSPQQHNYNLSLPPLDVQLEAGRDMAFALNRFTQPIWRPNTIYAIQVETLEVVSQVDGNGKPSESPIEYRRALTVGFKTAGPIGHFHQIGEGFGSSFREEYRELAMTDREAQYKYSDLRHYIDFERSYPNADGSLVNAKPLYYENASLSLLYRCDYIDSMYTDWDGQGGLSTVSAQLKTVIKDPASTAADADIVILPQWVQDPMPAVGKNLRIFKNMATNLKAAGKDCMQIDPIEQNRPVKKTLVPLAAHLAPQKLYTAVFVARYQSDPGSTAVEREVHRYAFQTSRYKSFEDQVTSYYLDRPANAVPSLFSITRTLTAPEIATAVQLFTDPTNASLADLNRNYQDEYDRLVSGALKLGDIPAAVTTEINIIRSGSRVLGILVRNPEPFSDPKIPREGPDDGVAMNVNRTLVITGVNGTVRKIFSRDLSKVFITNTQLNITVPATCSLVLRQMMYDGMNYVLSSPVTLNFNIPS